MMRSLFISFAISVGLFAATISAADSVSGKFGVDIIFTDDEIRIIRAYYDSHDKQVVNGKSGHRKKSLPPGIAKNLARGKPLPPGIATRKLPHELERALPPLRSGYKRIIVDGRVLLLEVATQIIHDVLSDAILQ
jgi:hypothetical protein